MVYYDVKVKYTLKEEMTDEKFKDEINSINSRCTRTRRWSDSKLFVCSFDNKRISGVLIFNPQKHSLSSAKREIKMLHLTKSVFESFEFSGACEEISVRTALSYVKEAFKNNSDIHCEHHISGYCNARYADDLDLKFDEIILPHSHTTYSDAVDEAHKLFADESLYNELERIYSPLNKHKFYGNPVHYKFTAVSRETAVNDIKLLAKALYSNQRLVSTRVTYITRTDYDSYESDLDELCDNSYGSLVAIECDPKVFDADCYANDFERMCELVTEVVEEKAFHTLFVIVVIGEGKKLADSIIQKLNKKDICFVELVEGCGDRTVAENYLKSLLKSHKVPCSKEDFVLPVKDSYTTADVYDAFSKIRKNSIKNSIYKAYKNVETIEVKAPKSVSNSYDKLQKMVGLTEIKAIIDQIISAQKVNKMRGDLGLDVSGLAKHMIFTGNPGSAKTTVARLLASILYDEHVTRRNKFVECGRQDLIGRYVGWTAKIVEEQFQKAKGGVLFIDEAYSLVEKDGLYGDEAINTIVQMMENYRDEVIVIFAGYPDKMKKFLDKNEGLRSRIAFHIDFPDYNGEELCDILKLMTEDKGYTLDEAATEKCKEIFDVACKNAEFGNGRFVRNVLEQAIIKQSSRIFSQYNSSEVDKNTISILSAADFDINAAETYKSPKVAIGF